MRNDLTQHQSLRNRSKHNTNRSPRRRRVLPLPADVVDAAFAEGESQQATDEPLTYADVVSRVHDQLEKLEAQRVQLQRLLVQASDLH